jgi:hypothetical protein
MSANFLECLERIGEALFGRKQHARAHHPDAGVLVGDAGVQAG